MSATKPIIRPAYEWSEAQHVADAAVLIAAEAEAEGCEVHRPFNGFMLEGRPGTSAASTLSWWYYQEGKVREENWRKKESELEAEIKRLQGCVTKYIDAHDRALKSTAAACRAAYDGGYAAGRAAGGGAA